MKHNTITDRLQAASLQARHLRTLDLPARNGGEIGLNRRHKRPPAWQGMIWSFFWIAATACAVGFIAASHLR